MTIKIQTTNNLTSKNGVKTLIYGPSGIGKTRTAITAPGPFILSAEKGLMSVRKHKIPYIDVSTYKDLNEAFTWVMQSAEARYIETLYLDSASEIAEVVLGEEQKKSRDGRAAYGEMQKQMYQMLRLFRDLPNKNVVLICKQQILEENFNQKKCYPVMPSAALLNQMPYFWDLVMHMYSAINPNNNSIYQGFHTQDTPNWSAKDRFGALDSCEPPDMGYIFKKCTG